jgi:hypothetical protein
MRLSALRLPSFCLLVFLRFLVVSKARARKASRECFSLSAPAKRGRGTARRVVEGACGGGAGVPADAPPTALSGGPPLPATRGGISDASLRASAKQSRAACAGSWIAWSLPLLAMTSLGRAKARCCLFARSVILSPLPLAGEDAPKARERVRPPFRAKRRRPLIPTFSPRAGRRCRRRGAIFTLSAPAKRGRGPCEAWWRGLASKQEDTCPAGALCTPPRPPAGGKEQPTPRPRRWSARRRCRRPPLRPNSCRRLRP